MLWALWDFYYMHIHFDYSFELCLCEMNKRIDYWRKQNANRT
jgi:hypothetical protein